MRCSAAKPLLGAMFLGLTMGCGSQGDETPGAPQGAEETSYEPVVATQLAKACLPEPLGESAEPADREQVVGLLQTLAGSDARFQKVAREELIGLGESASLQLASLLVPEPVDLPDSLQREALLALTWPELQDLGTIVAIATSGRLSVSPYSLPLRREALYQLGLLKDDRALLRLIRHLKYEKDPENFLWLGWALLELGNGAGVPALYDLTRSEDADLAARTHATLQQAADARGTTPEGLLPAWIAGDLEVWPTPEISPALRCLVWKEIEATSGIHFAMRGIDDARNQLKGLGTWIAEPLAAATRDQDMYVRLHAAQVLQRLGPRGRDAVPALEALLPDPTAGPTAAAALGSIGTPDAFAALSRAIHPDSDRPLQVAALQALAIAIQPTGGGEAQSLFEQGQTAGDHELAVAAAACLLRTTPTEAAFDYLVLHLPRPDSAFIERTLDRWFGELAEDLREPRAARYTELRTPRPGIPNMQDTLEARQALADWLQAQRSALLPPASGQ